jgi:hypothetical protein
LDHDRSVRSDASPDAATRSTIQRAFGKLAAGGVAGQLRKPRSPPRRVAAPQRRTAMKAAEMYLFG